MEKIRRNDDNYNVVMFLEKINLPCYNSACHRCCCFSLHSKEKSAKKSAKISWFWAAYSHDRACCLFFSCKELGEETSYLILWLLTEVK